MRKKTLQNLLTFLLVLVLTVCTVMALSLVSQAQADPIAAAAQVVEDTQAAAGNASAGELSASIPSRWAASPLACIAVGLRGRFPGYAGHCGHWPGRLSQGEALREARPAGAAQLHPPGGHGVPRQKQSIRVFVLSYFTSKQGRLHRRSCFFAKHRKRHPQQDASFSMPAWENIPAYLFEAANSAASRSHPSSSSSISSTLPRTTWWVQRLG